MGADYVGECQSMVEQVKSTTNWQLLGVDEEHLRNAFTCTLLLRSLRKERLKAELKLIFQRPCALGPD